MMLLTGRRDVKESEVAIPYSGLLVFRLSAIAVLDGLAALRLHLLLPRGIRTVAVVLGIVGFVWVIGFLVSLICYPVRSERIGFGSVSSMTSAARRPPGWRSNSCDGPLRHSHG